MRHPPFSLPSQVNSAAGTVAANYWFGGLHSAVTQSAPHAAPYLLRTLAGSMLDTARNALVSTHDSASLSVPAAGPLVQIAFPPVAP
jgi:hypothetical protein